MGVQEECGGLKHPATNGSARGIITESNRIIPRDLEPVGTYTTENPFNYDHIKHDG
jgi:hypothetical protein